MENFVKRLKMLLDYYNLNASSFADKIGVQRSSLSHLLSGRNKPSLDFIIKIIEEFPNVDLYWILQGKGTFPKNNETINSIIVKQENKINEDLTSRDINQKENPVRDLFNSIIADDQNIKDESLNTSIQKKESQIQHPNNISKIVIFYKDGTFEYFKSRV